MEWNYVVIGVLVFSIIAKLWLGFFYRSVSKKIDSEVLKAASTDSFSDVLSTGATLLSVLVLAIFKFDIDAYIGLVVSVLILIAGLKILNENKNIILGSAPDPEIIELIKRKALENPKIVGIHDLIVHSYGAGMIIASFHAEVDGKGDFFEAHDIIDNIEKQLLSEYNITCTIHMDPIVTDDEAINKLKIQVVEAIQRVGKDFHIHDFRCVSGPTHTNLIFDIEIPFEEKRGNREIAVLVQEEIKLINDTYFAVINIDRV